MKIAIVDDEKEWIRKVKDELLPYFDGTKVEIKCYTTGEEFLSEKEMFHIVFMDIEMPGIDGFSTLNEYKKINPEALALILTTHVEMSRHGYKVDAFRYIDKQCLDEMKEALDSALLRLKRYQHVEVPIVSMQAMHISCWDIMYFEVYGHEILMHLMTDDVYKCSESLSQLAIRLEKKGFLMTGRSYLVNIDHIKNVEPKNVILDNGNKIPLSKRRYLSVKKTFFNWKISRAFG